MNPKPCAVTLKEAARRLGFSYRTARRLVNDGRFPIPEQRRVGRLHRYSEVLIDRYLAENATEDAKPGARVHLSLVS